MDIMILLVVGGLALAIFIIQYLVQFTRIRHGAGYVSGGRAFINWLLLILIITSFGAYAYDSQVLHTHRLARIDLFHKHQEASQPVAKSKPKAKKTKHHQDTKPFIKWNDKKAQLNSDGVAPMALQVSPDTHVKIIGERTETVYKEFTTKKSKGQHTAYYDFQYAGKYRIELSRDGHHMTKEIDIRPGEATASSSASSQVSPQPAVNNNQQTAQHQATATNRANNNVHRVAHPQGTPVNHNYYRQPINNQQVTNSSYSHR